MGRNIAEAEARVNKLLGLELIRFFCTLSVLLWHYQHFSYVGDKPTHYISSQLPLYSLLHLFYDYGHYGVHVFWCLSGFIFFFKYRTIIATNALTPKTFFILRLSRLYPLHFVTLLLVLTLQTLYFSHHGYYFVYQNNGLVYFVFQLFMAGSWGFLEGMSFNGPIWSVSLEILVYVFFYLVLRRISSSFWVNVIIIALCAWAESNQPSPLFECIGFFYIGGLSAIAFQYRSLKQPGITLLGKLLLLTAMAVAPMAIWAAGIHRYKEFPVIFLSIYLPMMLVSVAGFTTQSRILSRILKSAGNMTYASYLIHFPLQLTIALACSLLHREIPYYSHVFFYGFMLSTLILSYCIFRFFELPSRIYIRNMLLR